MATFTKHMLSNSTNGVGVLIYAGTDGTAGSASTIHVAPAGTASRDEVWLWAYNMHTADLVLTIEWGTSGSLGERKTAIPYQAGLIPVAPGLPIDNSIIILGYASSAGKIIVDGFVNRITD